MKKFLTILCIALLIPSLVWAATKITELTEDTSPTTDDLVVTVNDPGGTPATRKSTIANLFNAANDLNTTGDVADDSHNHAGANLSDDIFVLNAGDTMTGDLTLQDDTNVYLGTDQDVSLSWNEANDVMRIQNNDSINANVDYALVTIALDADNNQSESAQQELFEIGLNGPDDSDASFVEKFAVDLDGDAYIVGDATMQGRDINLGLIGVVLTGDEGKLTVLGAGSGADEDLRLDFDTTANSILLTSSTGVTTMNYGAIGITLTGTMDMGGADTVINNGTDPTADEDCEAGEIFQDTDATSGQQLYACENGSFVLQGDGAGGGSGDVTDVGDCATGACFTGASGTTLSSNTDLIFDLDEDNNGTETFQVLDGADALVAEISETGTISALSGFDCIGNVDCDIGSADIDDITFITDGTGDGEIVLPNDSIGGDEIDWANMTDLSANGVVDDDSHAHTGSTLSGVDISDDTNLTCGTNCTLTGDEISVDDSFLLNTGDVGTGVYDFGGATSFEIVNGASPTVDATGEFALDTTGTQLIVYDGVGVVAFSPLHTKCAVIENLAAADDDFHMFSPADDIRVLNGWCICKGTCTTEADLSFEIRETGTASTVTDITGTAECEDEATAVAKDQLGGSGGATVTALDIIRWDVDNAVSPETDEYIICIEYVEVRQ